MTRVLVADDHQLLRQALRRALEDSHFEVVAEAADGEEAVRLVVRHRPDVVVMDVTMPVLDGIEATRRIHAATGETKVLVLTMHGGDALGVRALRAGAVGFLTKDCAMQEVVETVRRVARGDKVFSPENAAAMMREVPPNGESVRREDGEDPPRVDLRKARLPRPHASRAERHATRDRPAPVAGWADAQTASSPPGSDTGASGAGASGAGASGAAASDAGASGADASSVPGAPAASAAGPGVPSTTAPSAPPAAFSSV